MKWRRRAINLLAALILGYALLLGGLWAFQKRLIYPGW